MEFFESFRMVGDENNSFDIDFWQAQGDKAIFEAATEMLQDFFLIRGMHAEQFRLQRTIESFRKA
ncbi:MAG: hypothetical protein PHQ23_03570 [Candidatus Wallbacteria bacterium]|nr:hypothetical protein [Candidatus Wallbacteria bacterium]